MAYLLQFLLVVHVLGAIIGFGSTFAFAFFPQGETRLAPASGQPSRESASRSLVAILGPHRLLPPAITGALMIFETGRDQDFFSHTWLWIALGLYLILISIFTFVAFPDTRHEYEMTREERPPTRTTGPRGNPNVYGPSWAYSSS